jgi:hypothetical protein
MTSRAQIAALATLDGELVLPYRGEQRTVTELLTRSAIFSPDDYSAVRLALGGGKPGRLRARRQVPLTCPRCATPLTHFERAGRPAYFAAQHKHSPHGPHCDREPAPEADIVSMPRVAPVAPSPQATCYLIGEPTQADTAADVVPLADGFELLTLALHRALPPACDVSFQGQRYSIVSCAEVQQREDGDSVALYGRVSGAEWNQASGRLTLLAKPASVQVWATASLPRALLGLAPGHRVEAPHLPKPVPFLVFGTLKKLAGVWGVPVIRRDALVLLQPLALSAAQTARQAELSAALTRELDELLSERPPAAVEGDLLGAAASPRDGEPERADG